MRGVYCSGIVILAVYSRQDAGPAAAGRRAARDTRQGRLMDGQWQRGKSNCRDIYTTQIHKGNYNECEPRRGKSAQPVMLDGSLGFRSQRNAFGNRSSQGFGQSKAVTGRTCMK